MVSRTTLWRFRIPTLKCSRRLLWTASAQAIPKQVLVTCFRSNAVNYNLNVSRRGPLTSWRIRSEHPLERGAGRTSHSSASSLASHSQQRTLCAGAPSTRPSVRIASKNLTKITRVLQCEPTMLPEPNHVMLNHLYALSIKVTWSADESSQPLLSDQSSERDNTSFSCSCKSIKAVLFLATCVFSGRCHGAQLDASLPQEVRHNTAIQTHVMWWRRSSVATVSFALVVFRKRRKLRSLNLYFFSLDLE